jgi:hypothetical protein
MAGENLFAKSANANNHSLEGAVSQSREDAKGEVKAGTAIRAVLFACEFLFERIRRCKKT